MILITPSVITRPWRHAPSGKVQLWLRETVDNSVLNGQATKTSMTSSSKKSFGNWSEFTWDRSGAGHEVTSAAVVCCLGKLIYSVAILCPWAPLLINFGELVHQTLVNLFGELVLAYMSIVPSKLLSLLNRCKYVIAFPGSRDNCKFSYLCSMLS